MNTSDDSITLLQTQAMNIALQTLCLAIVQQSNNADNIIATFLAQKENLLSGILHHRELREEVGDELETAFCRLEQLL